MGAAETTIHALIRRAASAYAAGPSHEAARTICDRLAREGVSSTVCYWDVYSDHPAFISKAYAGLLRPTSNQAGTSDCYLSIKAPALKFDLSLVTKGLNEARVLNAIVHFDAVGPDTVDRTFDLIGQAREIYPRLGCTLPGRCRRSMEDADRAVAMGLRVRVVKGDWTRIGDDAIDPHEGFLRVIDCLAGRATHVAVATHNTMMARLSLRRLKNAGTPCELELSYGLPQRPMLRIARDFGVRARMYVPCGL